MGAVSYISFDAEAKATLPVDVKDFGPGYLDDWGSDFIIRKDEQGRLMIELLNLGGYLHPNALGGHENDSDLKAIREGTFMGTVFQWYGENHTGPIGKQDRKPFQVFDIHYHFVNSELVGISQGSVLFWTKDEYKDIDSFTVTMCEHDQYFFDGSYGDKPKRLATPEDFSKYPLGEMIKPTDPNIKPVTISFVEKHSPAEDKFIKQWADAFANSFR